MIHWFDLSLARGLPLSPPLGIRQGLDLRQLVYLCLPSQVCCVGPAASLCPAVGGGRGSGQHGVAERRHRLAGRQVPLQASQERSSVRSLRAPFHGTPVCTGLTEGIVGGSDSLSATVDVAKVG